MSKFLVALLFGAIQIILTDCLARAVNKQSGAKIFVFSAAKLVLYAVGIYPAIRKNFWSFDLIVCGFIAGAALMAILLYIVKYLYGKQITALLKKLIKKTKIIKLKK